MHQRIGTIKIGETDGYRYFGFQPPLTKSEFDGLPKPKTEGFSHDGFEWQPTSVEHFDDETMDVGYNTYAFGGFCEALKDFAKEVEQYLGNRVLDTEVRMIGPGSVTSQAAGALPQY